MHLASVLCNLQIQYHKYSVQKNLSTANHLQSISFTKKQWTDMVKIGNHEILIHGKLFDIHSIHQNANDVVLQGQYDEQEDKLIENAKFADKKNDVQKNETTPYFFWVVFADEPVQYTFERTIGIFNKIKTNNSCSIHSGYLQLDSPPPQLA